MLEPVATTVAASIAHATALGRGAGLVVVSAIEERFIAPPFVLETRRASWWFRGSGRRQRPRACGDQPGSGWVQQAVLS